MSSRQDDDDSNDDDSKDDDSNDDDVLFVPATGPGPRGPAPKDPRPRLDAGAKAGIAIGVILGVFIIGGLIYMYVRRRRRRNSQQRDLESGGLSTHQDLEAKGFNNLPKVPPKDEPEQVAYQHMGGGAPKYALSPLSIIGRPWPENLTVSTPSTEVEASAAYMFDGYRVAEAPAQRPVYEATIWEAPDTDRSGLLPVELPGSLPRGELSQSPTELTGENSPRTEDTGDKSRVA